MPPKAATDRELIASFRETGAEESFRALTEKYLGMVHGVAMRRTGRAAVAEEVTQNVFTALAKKSPRVEPGGTLAGWLFRCTSIESAEALRREAAHSRKLDAYSRHAEVTANGRSVWSEAMPLLDEAIAALSSTDRDLILERFFERKSFRDIGASLGKSEVAAQKQGERALEKLAALLARKGVVIPAALLAAGLTSHVAQAAPAGLAWTISAGTLAGFSSISSKSFLLKTLMLMSQSKTTTAVAIALVAAVPLAVQWNSNADLRREVAGLRAKLTEEKSRPAFLPAVTRAREAAVRRGGPAQAFAGPIAPAVATVSGGLSPSDWERALLDPDPLRRTQRFAQLLGALTRESAPDVARMFDQFKGTGRSFQPEHHLFLRAWGQLDGAAALAHVSDDGRKLDAKATTLAALAGWATTNPFAAKQWVEGLADSTTKEHLIFGLIDGWSMQDLNGASAYAASRPRSEARNQFRELLLERALAAGGVPGVQAWFGTIPNDEHNSLYKQRAFDEVIRAVLHRDPSSAAQWLAQQNGAAFVSKESVVETAAKLAKSAPTEALRWLDSMRALPDGAAKEGAGSIIANWAKADAAGAGAYLRAAQNHPQYDAMADALARQVAASDPRIALAWSRSLNEDAARQASENAVASAWLRKDKENASAFLRGSGWTDERLTAAQGKQAATVWLTAKGDSVASAGMGEGRLTGLTSVAFEQSAQVAAVARVGFNIALEQEKLASRYEVLAQDLLGQSKPQNWHDQNAVNMKDKNCAQCHK